MPTASKLVWEAFHTPVSRTHDRKTPRSGIHRMSQSLVFEDTGSSLFLPQSLLHHSPFEQEWWQRKTKISHARLVLWIKLFLLGFCE